jgi:hypothetical protein
VISGAKLISHMVASGLRTCVFHVLLSVRSEAVGLICEPVLAAAKRSSSDVLQAERQPGSADRQAHQQGVG